MQLKRCYVKTFQRNQNIYPYKFSTLRTILRKFKLVGIQRPIQLDGYGGNKFLIYMGRIGRSGRKIKEGREEDKRKKWCSRETRVEISWAEERSDESLSRGSPDCSTATVTGGLVRGATININAFRRSCGIVYSRWRSPLVQRRPTSFPDNIHAKRCRCARETSRPRPLPVEAPLSQRCEPSTRPRRRSPDCPSPKVLCARVGWIFNR